MKSLTDIEGVITLSNWIRDAREYPQAGVILKKFDQVEKFLTAVTGSDREGGWWRTTTFVLPSVYSDSSPCFFLKIGGEAIITFEFGIKGINVSVESERPLGVKWLNLFDIRRSAESGRHEPYFARDSYSQNHSNFSLWLWDLNLFTVFLFLLFKVD